MSILGHINYTDVILTIIAGLIGLIAFKVKIDFNVNDWMKEKRKIKEHKLRNICPHTSIIEIDGKRAVKSDFISPSGTLQWQCSRCKLVSYYDQSNQEYWAENIKELIKRNKKFNKGLKKIGYL
jgi:hypothetical protein